MRLCDTLLRQLGIAMPISTYLKSLRSKVGSMMLVLPSVAVVVFNKEGEVLFQKKPDGTWSLPAGMIEPDESPNEAALREVLEETGLEVRIDKIVGGFGGRDFTFAYANGDVVQYAVFVFQCEIIGGELQPHDDETAHLQFFSIDTRPRLELPYPESIYRR